MIPLDRHASQPLADQIETGLAGLIERRQLPPGARLPSIRALAAQLAVSPNTVVLAYDRLASAGRIESRGTIGYHVCEPPLLERDETWLEAGDTLEGVWLAQQANDQRPGVLLASSGALPPAWLEDAIPAAALQRGLARSSAGMASRCPPQGLPELRERIALLMRSQGLAVDASRLMTCYGGTHAIDLICRSFLRAGDTVLVEDPGYFLMFDRLRQEGVKPVGIRRRPDGLDLDELEAACREHRPRLLFLQPALHSPTGWSSSPANLHRLLVLARQHGLLIAEDDVHGHFHPGHPSRLAALAGLEGVIYYSSFCKVLSPALRMGYIAAEPALLKPLLRAKICSVLSSAALNEYVLLEVLMAGRLRKHQERLQRRLQQARLQCGRLLEQAGMRLDHPGEGGLFLWASVPEGVDVDELVQDAWRNKILLVPGATFSALKTPDPHIRFNVAFSQQARLGDYLRSRLGALSGVQGVLQRAAQR